MVEVLWAPDVGADVAVWSVCFLLVIQTLLRLSDLVC